MTSHSPSLFFFYFLIFSKEEEEEEEEELEETQVVLQQFVTCGLLPVLASVVKREDLCVRHKHTSHILVAHS